MKWRIPAKTFLLGEYAAVAGAGAIVLTTAPCFELSLTSGDYPSAIHPESPAGRWWSRCRHPQGLLWRDPYAGQGGLGASSAQFLGAWLADCYLSGQEPEFEAMLKAYYQSSWTGQGLRPSAYDVLAQSQQQCVYINRNDNQIISYDWPFHDLSFLLLHSGHKLATHHHLQAATLPSLHKLILLAEDAKQAFERADSEQLITTINAWQQELSSLHLTAGHTLRQLDELKSNPSILAAKGCGALGADVLLLLIPTCELDKQVLSLSTQGWTILASNKTLYRENTLIKKKHMKGLEFSS
ncbi:hypothetical protein [Legionella sp. CNM-4043-24]|uniref:hypothetical protein n=1 Tax=Legionella sp. CNM-4043-24 TaxID=3421646 RepID=UPI00403A94AC